MAAVSMKTVAANLAANAAAVGSAASLSTANVTALAAICTLLSNRPGDLFPLLALLSDTNEKEITSSY